MADRKLKLRTPSDACGRTSAAALLAPCCVKWQQSCRSKETSSTPITAGFEKPGTGNLLKSFLLE